MLVEIFAGRLLSHSSSITGMLDSENGMIFLLELVDAIMSINYTEILGVLMSAINDFTYIHRKWYVSSVQS